MDDWDFINELHTLSFVEFLIKPNPAGQLNPVFKAIYGVLMIASDYNNIVLAVFNFTIGVSTLILWLLILHHLDRLTLTGVLFLSCIRLSYAGLADVFLFPLQGALELAFFFFTLAIYLLIASRSILATIGAAVCLLASAFSWGNGLVVAAIVPMAFAVLYPKQGDKKVKAAVLLCASIITIAIFLLTPKPAEAGSFPALTDFLKYFIASAFINGALSGLAPNVFPAIVHILFFSLIVFLATRAFLKDDDWRSRFIILSLSATQMGISLVVSITRAHHGIAHAGSYRYVYMTLFIQLVILAMSARAKDGGVIKVMRIPAALLVALALFIGLRGRQDYMGWEKQRRDCLQRIMNGANSDCISDIYYRNEPEFIQRTAMLINYSK